MTALTQDIDRACARIAPTWPLDQFIAVNPYWGWVDQPMPQAAAALEALGGTRLTLQFVEKTVSHPEPAMRGHRHQ